MERTKLSDVRAGDMLIADEGFTCLSAGPHRVRSDATTGLYVTCQKGEHSLDGQADETGHLVGLVKLEQ